MGSTVRSQEPSTIDAVQNYRPACSKCGALTSLARIEPSDEDDHDLRTFECMACDHSEVVKIKFR